MMIKFYAEHLSNYMSKLGNVTLHNTDTMADKPYNKLYNAMGVVNNFVKKTGQGVDFFDEKMTNEKSFIENKDSNNILVKVSNYLTGQNKTSPVVKYDEKSDVPFLRQIYQRVSELVTGKKEQPIDTEVKRSRARYAQYLKDTSTNYSARRSNVGIKDPHTMVAYAYYPLREHIDTINSYAKKNNKSITFEDARALTRDDEFVSPVIEEDFANKVLVSVKDIKTGKVTHNTIDYFKDQEKPFMKKVSNTLGELVSGKKGTNIDKELGLKAD